MLEDINTYASLKYFEETLKTVDDINKYNRIINDVKEHFHHTNLHIRVNKMYTYNNELIKSLFFTDKSNPEKTLRAGFGIGKITLTKNESGKISYDFNTDGLLIEQIISIDDLEHFGIDKKLLRPYGMFLPGLGKDEIETHVIYKKYEGKDYLKEIFFVDIDRTMYISCETGCIKQFMEEEGRSHLERISTDSNFILQPCLEEILENMHSHNKPILQKNESDLEK